jgi:flagellar basal-body rod modification protein FlgD
MTTDPTSSVGTSTVSATSTQSTNSLTGGLGQDAFLKLLVTQLQYQDPTKPVDDAQMLTQLATFSSLEKLSTIADAVQTLAQALTTTTTSSTAATTQGQTSGTQLQ